MRNRHLPARGKTRTIMEFKAPSAAHIGRPSGSILRLALWCEVVALAAVALFALAAPEEAVHQMRTPLTLAAVTMVIGAIAIANVIAIRAGLEKIKRNLRFELTADELVRKRSGWPEVHILLNEISAIHERRGWLDVIAPKRRIAIPEDVQGFRMLRQELAKHKNIAKAPSHMRPGLVLLAASFTAWAIVFLSSEPYVVTTAGICGLGLMTWSMVGIITALQRNRIRVVLWGWLLFSWLAALWIIQSRIAHLHRH